MALVTLCIILSVNEKEVNKTRVDNEHINSFKHTTVHCLYSGYGV
jgi:hypothetical protein